MSNKKQSELNEGIDRVNMDFRVSMPCVVVDVNDDKSLVRVKLGHLERSMSREGREIEYTPAQEIPDVPVGHYSSSKGYLWVDIEPEMHGQLHFCDFDLQRYINGGADLDLASSRFHDFNDCYFTPGDFCFARRIDPIDADIGISSLDGTSCVAIKGGKVTAAAREHLEIKAPLVTINGLPWTTTNPVIVPPYGTFAPIPPATPKEPKEVRR